MGQSKTDLFTEEQNRIASYAKALAHPARVLILESLASREACVCGELVETVGLAQATVSQHLKELKTMGLIQGTVEGTSICYCIHPQNWARLKETFSNLFSITAAESCSDKN